MDTAIHSLNYWGLVDNKAQTKQVKNHSLLLLCFKIYYVIQFNTT